MGLLKGLKPRLPRVLGRNYPLVYRATVQAGSGNPHTFAWADGDYWDKPIVLQNERGFRLPEDAVFVEVASREQVPFRESETAVRRELEARSPEAVGDADPTVKPPETFRGEYIPPTEVPSGKRAFYGLG